MAITPVSEINWFLPFAIAAIVAVVFLFLTCYLADKLKKIRSYAGIVETMAECKGGTMGILVDKGSNLIPFCVEYDMKNKGLVKHKRYTLLHPDLSKMDVRHKLKGGPDVVFYPLPGYFPFAIQTSAALVQLRDDLKKDPRFSWISDELALLSAFFNNSESFPIDVNQIVKDSVSFGDEIPEGYLEDDYDDPEDQFDEEGSELIGIEEGSELIDVEEERETDDADEYKDGDSK